MRGTLIRLLAAGAVLGTAAVTPPAAHADTAGPRPTIPVISPTPQSMTRSGGHVQLAGAVQLVTDHATDPAAKKALLQVLADHGVRDVSEVAPGSEQVGAVTIRLGNARPDIRKALGETEIPGRDEGYALVSGGRDITIGGADGAGQFYGVQTFRQLFMTPNARAVAQVRVSDYPAMPLRGAIEGFYGQPWSQQARLDQLDFLGSVKANTYIYAPKDDPYHRDQWRTPYPADKLAELQALVTRASANHVRFTFAVSPGNTVCLSSAADRAAMKAKFQQLYDAGVRAFSIPFDDINYTKWNCAADQEKYGAPGRGSAGAAQADFLNDIQRTWIDKHDGTFALQTVPTEYSDLADSAYKTALRTKLDPAVVVQWTGTDVVPPSVTNDDAEQAAANFGRKVFLWDNYPVNDFGQTSGRLLLAPYAYRQAGLSDHLAGVVANPMNQAYASQVVEFGAADFAWNDTQYDASRSWAAAMSALAGGDPKVASALLVLGDMEHAAPTFGPKLWQPQAPVLAAKIDAVNGATGARRTAALRDLRAYAVRIEQAPAIIRGSKIDPGFLTDAGSWLDAMEHWGAALVAAVDGDRSAARREMDAARAIRVDPSPNRWGSVEPKVGDGVLDVFVQSVIDSADQG
ncbi:beta-N-acetylhexosaminidase family protein [Flexivirga meconopsidis]|uniref:beta-N-acetylhexosaminidase family protein n=1 Tax=Flexivirga meconopsidis TaxID=2977121 RepID=UPI00223E8F48|nr:beta-N-acetylglucosaminidase domain-containing protein [Flexivirga meconopsidis]